MTPGVVWQLTNHYERGAHEAEQAHARLAARLRHLVPRRRPTAAMYRAKSPARRL